MIFKQWTGKKMEGPVRCGSELEYMYNPARLVQVTVESYKLGRQRIPTVSDEHVLSDSIESGQAEHIVSVD